MINAAQVELLDSLDTGVLRVGFDSRVVQMNGAAEACLMVSRERAHGVPIQSLLELPEELASIFTNGESGEQVVRLHELKFPGGIFDCTIHVTRQQDWLLELHNLEWEQRRLRLQQREVQTGMLELLSRNLGHEVRNPLGGIRGAAQMLAEELHDGELAMLAQLIMRESDRIDELTRRFGQPELSRSSMDLYPLLDEALALLAAEFGDSLQVERDYDPSIPPISADASAIRQVLLNLLRNAYQSGATKILIRTRIRHNGSLLQSGSNSVLRVDIADDGEGVPESLQSLLFLPLVTGRRDGTGLGLSLSQQIASAHSGLLTFEALQKGSQFSLLLPLTNGHENTGQGEMQ